MKHRFRRSAWPLDKPLRSLLFVPGNRPEKVSKAWGLGADCIILDLEDSVPEAEKHRARRLVHDALEAAPSPRPFAVVRTNPGNSFHWRNDVDAVVTRGLQGIMLPKCESAEEIASAHRTVAALERRRRLKTGSIQLLLLLESARGLLEASRLAQASDRVVALVLGGEDLCLDMGIERTKEGSELAYPRWMLALCARAYGCMAIDTIYAEFNDPQELLRDAETAKRAGFCGKLAIHPKQIGPIHAAFTPGEHEVAEAEKVLAVFAEAEAKGTGAVALNGKMIDKPIVERARRVLAMAGRQSRRDSQN
jgi:citrate lyase subunit beta / citryl-CoA lyase